jgi:SAM-dependent methyltransferase
VAEHNRLYAQCRYYDILFNRDVSRDVDFLLALYRRQNGRPPGSMLELACGPGYHARAFARHGRRAVGLDLRPGMTDFARDRAAAEGVAVEWIVGDMRDVRLAVPVDLALCVNSGVDCLLTNDEIVRHFRSIAAGLNPAGLYVVELTHPRDCSPYQYGSWHYQGERDGVRVTLDWATNRPLADPVTQVSRVQTVLRVTEDGREQTYSDEASERFCSAQEIVALAELSGALRVIAWYGAFDLDQPLDNSSAASAVVAVLQATPGEPPRG